MRFKIFVPKKTFLIRVPKFYEHDGVRYAPYRMAHSSNYVANFTALETREHCFVKQTMVRMRTSL